MQVTNDVMPKSRDRVGEMMEPGPDGSIFMVNLLNFKERAEYEDGRRRHPSGRRSACTEQPDWPVN